MTKKSNKSDASFLIQGSILAVASIISRIVGLLYRVPLTATIGKTGNDYYGTAYEIYNIILLISSYSIPLAVSKLVSARVSNQKFKDAYKVLCSALVFAIITGGLASCIVFFGAEFFTGVCLKTPLAAIALKVLAPTLFIVAILGVIRGFFQGLGTMIPSAISQVIEQIINAIVSVVAANLLFSYGKKVGAVLGDKNNYAAAFGAAGGTLGTLTGAVFALVFLIFIFFAYKKVFKKLIQKDKSKENEGFYTIFSLLIMTCIPVLLSTTVYNISSIIDQGIFKNISVIQGYDKKQISEFWGVFTGQYKVLINVPISIASALAASTVPSLTSAYYSGDQERVKKQIIMGDRFIMIVAFPCAIGMAVLASPIMQLLFRDNDSTSALMLIVGSCSIVFYSISTLSNAILQGIDKLSVPVFNAVIALVAHLFVLILLLCVFRLNIFAVIGANAFYALLMCYLNGKAVKKYSNVKYDIGLIFVKPFIAAAIMGFFVYLSYRLIYAILCLNMSNSIANAIGCIVAIIVGGIIYFAALLLVKGIDDAILAKIPGGKFISKIAYSLHLLR